jgi:hypothetical protein
VEDRREAPTLATNDPTPPQPDPAPLPREVPGPIPGISTQPVHEVPPVQEASPLASCFWCERLHPSEHPLSVCPACAGKHSMMRSLEMSGSYPLNDEAIDEALTRTSPGNYALGYMDGDTFNVFYVGRSDSDVRQRLHEWVGMPSRCDNYASPAKAPWGVHRRGQLPLDIAALGRVETAESSYTRFAYNYARSPEEAYAREWRNYDAFGGSRGLDNETQPVAAAG